MAARIRTLRAKLYALLAPLIPRRTRGELASPVGPPSEPTHRVPAFEFVYECEVTLQEMLDFGKTHEGTRRVIPITGGSFRGPRLSGSVLPGGADWNLLRTDGAQSVEAAYYLRTDDDVLLRIVNRGKGGNDGTPPVLVAGEHFCMFTTPVFEAPVGKYDWLNRATFVGTLSIREERKDAVQIQVFRVV